MENEIRNLREEVKEIISRNKELERCTSICFDIYDEEKIIEEILALEPFATVERVKQWCENHIKYNKNEIALAYVEDVYSLLNQPEEFDVREWCEKNDWSYSEKYDEYSKDFHIGEPNQTTWHICLSENKLNVKNGKLESLCFVNLESIPKSRYLFEVILKAVTNE